jgi:hypothetical protein
LKADAVAATTVTRLGRFGPYLFIVPATTAIGAVSSTLAGSVGVVAIGALVGVGWGVLLGRIAGWLRGREDRDLKLANRSMFLAVLVATTLFGGSLFAMTLYAAASAAPETMLFLMRPPMKGGFTFFLIFNALMEWLVIPAAVYLNWHLSQRRVLIVAGALLYYAARVWTYLYFVPNIFEFMATSAAGPLSAELMNRVTRWVNLSWVRAAIDGLTAVLFLVAASKADAPRSHV